MAKKLSNVDILKIQETYQKLGTYAAVSRELGFSPSTVKKYVTSESNVLKTKEKISFIKEEKVIVPKPIEEIIFPKTKEEWRNWCSLTTEEVKEVLEFSKEL